MVLAASLASFGCAASGTFDLTDLPPETTSSRPRIQVDAGSLLGPDGPEVAVACRIPYPELFFTKEGEVYRSSFDLIMVLYRGRRQVGGDLWPESVLARSHADTKSSASVFQKIVRLPTEPGKLRAEVSLNEPASGRVSKVSWDLEVPDYAKETLSLTTLWVTNCAEAGGTGDSIPPIGWILDHRFGEPLPALCVIGEVYRRKDLDKPCLLTWRIHDERRSEVQRGDTTLVGTGSLAFRLHPTLSTLWLGSYVFEVTVKSGGAEARRRFPFQMDESNLALETNVEQGLELVRIIATSEEIDELEAAKPTERKEAWNRFWKRRDPTSDTEENEFKEEFLARVRYANQHFAVLEPGWRSDRGRTYIEYGPPDQIESRPHNVDGPPYEIWIYERLGKRFVFVDYDGFGRYQFYQPGR